MPSHPEKVMVLRNIGAGRHPIVTCSVPFQRFGRVNIGGRGTIVSLADQSLAVFSPVALTQTVREKIDTELGGKLKYIIALDQEHHIFLTDWQKQYPAAKVVVPEPLAEKRLKQGQLLPTRDDQLIKIRPGGSSVDAGFDSEFEMEYVDAHPNKELVFNHKPTKTLIQADMMFNLPATEQMSRTNQSPTAGLLTKLFCSLTSTQGNAMGQRRVLWWFMSAGNRPAYNKSIARINEWDFERIIPCHGDVIETGGKSIFRKVCLLLMAAMHLCYSLTRTQGVPMASGCRTKVVKSMLTAAWSGLVTREEWSRGTGSAHVGLQKRNINW